MYSFTPENAEELRSFLQKCNIHDGVFRTAIYDQCAKRFNVSVENIVWNDSVDMAFCGIRKFITISDYKWGKDETIIDLAVLNGKEKLPECIDTTDCKDMLCFVWEMLSGNCIHIVCSQLRMSTGDGSMC